MRISDWSSDVCSSDLVAQLGAGLVGGGDDLGLLFAVAVERLLVDRHHSLEGPGELLDLGDRLALHGRRHHRRRRLARSEEHTSELQSLMRISYAAFCLKKKNTRTYCVNGALSI